jgi:hypothetical protein
MTSTCCLVCSACFIATSLLSGDTILDTFGPGNSILPAGVTVGGGIFPRHDPPPNQGATVANEFQPTFSSTLDEIDLDLQFIENPSGVETPNLDVSIFNSVDGQPGVPIETILLTDVNGGSNAIEMVSALSSSHPLLTAGTDYWLVIAPPDLLNTAFNVGLSPLSSGFIASAGTLGDEPWQVFDQNQGGVAALITGTSIVPTPEPSVFPWELLGAILFCLFAHRRGFAHHNDH